ncbi:hypothetical protein, partial [Ligilactobacillus ruminis]|uniref:hypothetical protein n=1 Tax=Ligilactobacillus ruminis TaxID=1623 RepID=UPI003F977757
FVCPPSIILLGDLIIPGRRALGSLFFINLHHYTGITHIDENGPVVRKNSGVSDLILRTDVPKSRLCP